MRWRLSLKTSVRGLALIGILVGCVGLIATLVNNKQEAMTSTPDSGMSLRGFQTVSHNEGRLHMRVSGDSLAFSKTRLWGPFRLGFAHSLVVRNLKVELFPDSSVVLDAHSPPLSISIKQTWAALTPTLARLLQSASLRNGGGVIMSARLTPVQIVEQRAGRTTVLLTAASCKTTRALRGLVCMDGWVRVGGRDRPFREWRSGLFLREKEQDGGAERQQGSTRLPCSVFTSASASQTSLPPGRQHLPPAGRPLRLGPLRIHSDRWRLPPRPQLPGLSQGVDALGASGLGGRACAIVVHVMGVALSSLS